MGLGINTATQSGEIVPIIKYDARAGRTSRIDRADGINTPTDITNTFAAIFDMENIEVGWMNFNTGGAPDFRLVKLGDDAGQRPGEGHKEGFRVMLKLSSACGGDVREFCHNAKTVIQGFDALHDAYLEGVKVNPGKLPVVKITETKVVKAGSGAKTSTNYMPVFAITAWKDRPDDLVFKPRGNGASQTSPQPASSGSTPPSTGATQMSAPKPTEKTALAMADAEDDFG